MYENYDLRPKAESTNTPAGGQWYYPTTSAQSTLDFFFLASLVCRCSRARLA